jgi:hypothetical protein
MNRNFRVHYTVVGNVPICAAGAANCDSIRVQISDSTGVFQGNYTRIVGTKKILSGTLATDSVDCVVPASIGTPTGSVTKFKVRLIYHPATGVEKSDELHYPIRIMINPTTAKCSGIVASCEVCSSGGGSGSGTGTGRLAPAHFTPEEIALYPNPTTDRFTLQVPEYEAATEVLITDIQGRLIDKRSLYSSINEIETNELPNGIYFVRIAQGERSTVLKLVIVK